MIPLPRKLIGWRKFPRKFPWVLFVIFIVAQAVVLSNKNLDIGARDFFRWRTMSPPRDQEADHTGLKCCAEVWEAGEPGDKMTPIYSIEKDRGRRLVYVLVDRDDTPKGGIYHKKRLARSVHIKDGELLITRYHLVVGGTETGTVNIVPSQWTVSPQ